MPRSRRTPMLVALALVILALGFAAWFGQRLAARELKAAIESALGPRASVERIDLGLAGVTITGLRVRAERGWPTEDELRATQVRLTPALRSLFGPRLVIERVEIDGAYVSLLRDRSGRLRLLPALLERPAEPVRRTAAPAAPASAAAASRPVHVGRVVLNGARVDFADASVRRPAHRMTLTPLDARVGPIDWPALDTAAELDIAATLRGPKHEGRLSITGTLVPATREATLKAAAHGVDLIALQPYLLKATEAGVAAGTLDLTLDARVRDQHLHAPGQVTLTGLELAGDSGLLGTFAGVPRQLVVAAMQRDGRIQFAFTLDGRLDDPSFSLNDNLATRLAGGLAQTLGVSLGGVVQGVGSVIKGLLGR